MDESSDSDTILAARTKLKHLLDQSLSIDVSNWPEDLTDDVLWPDLIDVTVQGKSWLAKMKRHERYSNRLSKDLEKSCGETGNTRNECPCDACASVREREDVAGQQAKEAYTMCQILTRKLGIINDLLRRYYQTQEPICINTQSPSDCMDPKFSSEESFSEFPSDSNNLGSSSGSNYSEPSSQSKGVPF